MDWMTFRAWRLSRERGAGAAEALEDLDLSTLTPVLDQVTVGNTEQDPIIHGSKWSAFVNGRAERPLHGPQPSPLSPQLSVLGRSRASASEHVTLAPVATPTTIGLAVGGPF